MTGELLSIENNKMTVTSLDGHRISVRNIELQESYPKMEGQSSQVKLYPKLVRFFQVMQKIQLIYI